MLSVIAKITKTSLFPNSTPHHQAYSFLYGSVSGVTRLWIQYGLVNLFNAINMTRGIIATPQNRTTIAKRPRGACAASWKHLMFPLMYQRGVKVESPLRAGQWRRVTDVWRRGVYNSNTNHHRPCQSRGNFFNLFQRIINTMAKRGLNSLKKEHFKVKGEHHSLNDVLYLEILLISESIPLIMAN